MIELKTASEMDAVEAAGKVVAGVLAARRTPSTPSGVAAVSTSTRSEMCRTFACDSSSSASTSRRP